jgi:nitrate reductase assembly molybdenum cofactor insertion protein NarJ
MKFALILILALWVAAPALADDASDCAAGIEMIKGEIAKNPAADVLEKLNKALKDAEREAAEQEYEECFEAIDDVKEAVAG